MSKDCSNLTTMFQGLLKTLGLSKETHSLTQLRECYKMYMTGAADALDSLNYILTLPEPIIEIMAARRAAELNAFKQCCAQGKEPYDYIEEIIEASGKQMRDDLAKWTGGFRNEQN